MGKGLKYCRVRSVVAYLRTLGIECQYRGNIYVCSSPFSRDTNWSFTVYPTNSYYCWSTGSHGDIIDLVRHFNSCGFGEALRLIESLNLPEHNVKDFEVVTEHKSQFDYSKYINRNKDEVEAIFSYAKSRRITSGFLPGVYFTRVYTGQNDFYLVRQPSLMFLHVDKDLKICGAKFRNINDNIHPRFTARGDLGFYILDTGIPKAYGEVRKFLCESETSANSLWQFLTERGVAATIYSMGGVSNPPKETPVDIQGTRLLLIIDYDGDGTLYEERLKKYSHLNIKPIKLILPKNEDINSLYCQDKMYLIEKLLLN